jgi:hypothetical protein
MSEVDTEFIGQVFSALARALKRLSRDDIELFRKGQLELRFVPTDERRSTKREGQKSKRPAPFDAGRLVEALRATTSREEAQQLLLNPGVSVPELRTLARMLDAAVLKDDAAERLRAKVVEAAIGFRLRSEAIRGRS